MPNLIGVSGKARSGKSTVAKMIQSLAKDNPWEIRSFGDKLKDITCLLTGCTREQLEDQKFKESTLGEQWKDKYGEALTPRKLMQLLGTECGREIIHPDIWVNALFADFSDWEQDLRRQGEKELKDGSYNVGSGEFLAFTGKKGFIETTIAIERELRQEGGNDSKSHWVIPDVRFQNEKQAIEDRGGIVIRIDSFSAYWIEVEEKAFFSKMTYHPSETDLDDSSFDAYIQNDGALEHLIEQVKQTLQTQNVI